MMNSLSDTIRDSAANIRFEGVTKRYDHNEVIPEFNAEFQVGEFTVVLGPSGCGKSTLMLMIAGIERVSGGKILIGDREVQELEPKERGCAMVFQNYALYPHMSVFNNIAYSLKIAKVPKEERKRRVGEVARILSLSDYLNRRPSQLSGGQRQRVAIGRAIVREPQVLLFDEPLSNLDAQLRHDMRLELADLHKRIGATTVFVTHDQVEAMTLADRILIMNEGRIEQFGSPREVYHQPASIFVAKFIGSPPMNLIDRTEELACFLPEGQASPSIGANGEYKLGIRPENIVIDDNGPLEVSVHYCEDLGSHNIIIAELSSGQQIRIATPFGTDFHGRTRLKLTFPKKHIHLFNAETGRTMGRLIS
jgi:sn-glycerol 3-phosphate transport system ATP-binding protein